MRKIVGMVVCFLLLAACSAVEPASETTNKLGGFPATVKSCDKEITIEKKPERIMVMGAVGLAALNELDMIELVAAHSGNIDFSVMPDTVVDAVKAATHLEGQKMDTGGSIISTEAILEARVDLVFGYDSGVDREALAKAGVPLYSPDAFCPGYSIDKASFDLVYDDLKRIATMTGATDKVAGVVKELSENVPKPATAEATSGATLYITPGVEKIWAYGPSSMVQPIMESNALRNVYDDQTERVPEISAEDLIHRNPETLIILYGEGAAKEARATFLEHKGIDAMSAVRNDRIIMMPFALTDPPSPLSMQGASYLSKELAKLS